MSWVSKQIPKSRVVSDSQKKARRKASRPPRSTGGRERGRIEIYGSAINQLRKDVSYVMSMLNVEDKYIDTGATTTLSGAWQLFLLNGCQLGTTATTRNGQSIKLHSLEFRAFLTMNGASTAVQSSRIVLFADKQSNAAAPTATDIYPAAVAGQRVVSYLDRFTIIRDEWFVLDPNAPSGELLVLSLPMNFHVSFNTGNVGDVTDITRNSIYMMVLSDAGANFPTLVWTNRLGFVDN